MAESLLDTPAHRRQPSARPQIWREPMLAFATQVSIILISTIFDLYDSIAACFTQDLIKLSVIRPANAHSTVMMPRSMH
jgi:hypothetical protein